jgi:hypothetical protein
MFFFSSFIFYKVGEQEGRTDPAGTGERGGEEGVRVGG